MRPPVERSVFQITNILPFNDHSWNFSKLLNRGHFSASNGSLHFSIVWELPYVTTWHILIAYRYKLNDTTRVYNEILVTT